MLASNYTEKFSKRLQSTANDSGASDEAGVSKSKVSHPNSNTSENKAELDGIETECKADKECNETKTNGSLQEDCEGTNENLSPFKNSNLPNGDCKDDSSIEKININDDGSAQEQPDLFVEGKAIGQSRKIEGPAYTGKGKSGGKGGKVKGASAITTAVTNSPPSANDEEPVVTESADPLQEVLAEADLNSDDEDEQDETFDVE